DQKILRQLDGEPLAYILGFKYFWNHKLYVTKDTLIPRADTETVVATVLDDIPNKDAPLKILDLGTGTGAIGLALAAELANSQGVA
ncbi:peptide chain release factor N(5)-glutamine methyltransferase, partial [Francisella tularensis subsp. holarctica]|nr:peptide chain release factor N(5)-glutamine methyltransferase [Francisella tularensis subsp. holarctica]